jgi:hypothetical protein
VRQAKMKNAYEKLQEFENLVKAILPQIKEDDLRLFVDHIVREQDGVRKILSENERIIKDVILRYGYKPKTVRYWYLFTLYPRHIQDEIKQGSLTANKAYEMFRNFKVRSNDHIEKEVIIGIRNYVHDTLGGKEYMLEGENNGQKK